MPDSESDSKFDELIDNTILDVKAVMLLMEKKSDFYNQIRKKFSESGDKDVRLFQQIISERRKSRQLRGIIISIAELILAFFLILFGISTVSPSLMGIDSFSALISFYTSFEKELHGVLPLSMILLIDLFISIMLLLAAFYIIRDSAISIREAGLRERKF